MIDRLRHRLPRLPLHPPVPSRPQATARGRPWARSSSSLIPARPRSDGETPTRHPRLLPRSGRSSARYPRPARRHAREGRLAVGDLYHGRDRERASDFRLIGRALGVLRLSLRLRQRTAPSAERVRREVWLLCRNPDSRPEHLRRSVARRRLRLWGSTKTTDVRHSVISTRSVMRAAATPLAFGKAHAPIRHLCPRLLRAGQLRGTCPPAWTNKNSGSILMPAHELGSPRRPPSRPKTSIALQSRRLALQWPRHTTSRSRRKCERSLAPCDCRVPSSLSLPSIAVSPDAR